MTAADWLKDSESLLISAGVQSARLDSLILLEDEIGKDRGWLLAHPELELSTEQTDSLQKLLTRRTAHEPIAYIRGKSEFYGRDFVVNKHVLVPRPESEEIIGLLLEIYPECMQQKANIGTATSALYIADIGTGSGALGITAKLELPEPLKVVVDLIDIDSKALKVAKTNVDLLTTGVRTLKSHLLADTQTDYDVMLCNLPYVPDKHPINQAAAHEPSIALFSGPDGLDHYRTLFAQLSEKPNKPLYLLFEAFPFQHPQIEELAVKNGYTLIKSRGYALSFKLNLQ